MHGRHIRGADIRLLREEADVSRERMAPALRCSPGYLKNIEAASDQPGGALAFRIARYLSSALGRPVTIDDFSHPVGATHCCSVEEPAA